MVMNKIYLGDNQELIKELKDESIDMVLTSPPYDNLRTYEGTCEWDFDIFKKLANELKRVLKKGGVIVWVIGDKTEKGSETGTSFKHALYFKEIGLNLHDTMIYQKYNFANPSANRYHQIFEYMFIISKGKPNVFNPIKDRKNICAGRIRRSGDIRRQVDGSMKKAKYKERVNAMYGMRYNIWKYKTGFHHSTKDKRSHIHPAIFPEKLAKDHIKTWTNKGDVILDPFVGSGTTAVMSFQYGRKFIGFEKVEKYYNLANERIFDISRGVYGKSNRKRKNYCLYLK